MSSTELISAVKQRDKDRVHALLDAGDVDIDFVDDVGKTALIYAVLNGDVDIIKLLIKYGADLDKPEAHYYNKNDRKPPLIHAVQSGNEDIVNLLIHAGADVNKSDKDSKTALLYAVQQNNEVLARSLIQTGLASDDSSEDNLSDSDGSSEDNLSDSDVSSENNLSDSDVSSENNLSDSDVSSENNLSDSDVSSENNLSDSDGSSGDGTGLPAMQNEASADINKALVYAVQNQNKSIVNLLIRYNADINKHDQISLDMKTPLIQAVETNNIEIVSILINSGADVNLTDNSKKTALFYAAKQNNKVLTEILIKAKIDINKVDKFGKTSLFYAVEYCHEEIAIALMNAKADMNITDNNGQTALFTVTHCNVSDIKEIMAESGKYFSSDRTKRDALKHILQRNKLNLAKALISAKADVNIADKEGKTALFYAVEKGNTEMTHALIGAKANVNITDNQHKTALFYTVVRKKGIDLKLTQALMKAGVDVDIKDVDGKTALFHIVAHYNKCDPSVVSVLLDASADVNTVDNHGRTALFYASLHRKEEIANVLIKAGTNVNIVDNEGKTALFHAVVAPENVNIGILQLLIGAGADVNITDGEGKTALFYAAQLKRKNIVESLLNAGSDVNKMDNKGLTPLLYACGQMYVCLRPTADITRTILQQKVQHKIVCNAVLVLSDELDVKVDVKVINEKFGIIQLLIFSGANVHVKDMFGNDALSFFVNDYKYWGVDDISHIIEVFQAFEEYGVQRRNVVMSILNTLFHRVLCFYKPLSFKKMVLNLVNLAAQFLQNEDHPEMKEAIARISKKIEDLKNYTAPLVEIVTLLIKLGVDPNSTDLHGNTGLHYAACLPLYSVPQETVLEVWKLLKKSGARLNTVNHDKETPLMYCLSRYLDKYWWEKEQVQGLNYICEFFLKDASSFNQVSSQGDSFFHYIIRIFQRLFAERVKQMFYQEAIQLLLLLLKTDHKMHEKAAQRPNEKLETPLHIWATLNKYYETTSERFETLMRRLLEYLLKHGAKVNARDENDEIPLHLCQTWCAVKLLVGAGANTTDMDSTGRTPLLTAAIRYKERYGRDGLYSDCTDDPDVFWKSAIDIGLNPWARDKDDQSVLSVLLDSSNGFKLSEALVKVACDNTYCKSGDDVVTLLNAICRDKNDGNHWKENFVKMLLKYKDRLDLRTALISCYRNLDEYVRKQLPSASKKDFSESVYWKIAQRLRFYGADHRTSNSSGVSSFDITKSCQVLKDLISQPIDINEVPIAIPWKESSEEHRDKLAKTARRQECEEMKDYWYHQEEIAKGSFGVVFAGINSKDGREVAIKRIDRLRMTSPRDKREIGTLISTNHEQVVRYLNVIEDKNFVYVVLELLEGNLETADFLQDNSFNRSKNIKLCKQVLSGVKYLHDKDILHRDLKPSNILYTVEPRYLKIADFGLSRCIANTSTVYGTNAGTRCWMAPEILKGIQVSPSEFSDIFACGLVLHYILSVKNHPFAPDKSALDKPLEIHKTEGNILNSYMEGWDQSLPPEAAHLLRKMLESSDKKRPTAAQALAHPMFWSEKKKMSFLGAVGNQPEFECPRSKRHYLPVPKTTVEKSLEAEFPTIVTRYHQWNDPGYVKMTKIFNEATSKYTGRTYDITSVVELVRFVRNSTQHLSDKSADFKHLVLEDFAFFEEFPNLVIEVFKAVTKHGWDEDREEIKSAITK